MPINIAGAKTGNKPGPHAMCIMTNHAASARRHTGDILKCAVSLVGGGGGGDALKKCPNNTHTRNE